MADHAPGWSNSRPQEQAAFHIVEKHLGVTVVEWDLPGRSAALDAASRGLHVGLVEARDWASGTSSRSSKLIHGGLRYLEMLDFRLVFEALRERGLLMKTIAPHLVRPVQFLYRLRRRVWERLYVGAGILLYDLLAVLGGNLNGLRLHRHLSRGGAAALP
jgi:glycerol-3-phosphate dehydrogenase